MKKKEFLTEAKRKAIISEKDANHPMLNDLRKSL